MCKREAAEVTDYEDRHYVQSHQKYKHRRSPFGIVYKDGKPIGILEVCVFYCSLFSFKLYKKMFLAYFKNLRVSKFTR